MRSALVNAQENEPISVVVTDENNIEIDYAIRADDAPYPTWEYDLRQNGASIKPTALSQFLVEYARREGVDAKGLINSLQKQIENFSKSYEYIKTEDKSKRKYSFPLNLDIDEKSVSLLFELGGISMRDHQTLRDFIIYSPENTALRMFEREGQIQPLGINGEGLLKLLTVMSKTDKSTLDHIKRYLKVFGWFEDFSITEENGAVQMSIQDGFVRESLRNFDQRSANEGFLFVAFYFSLFSSKLTPNFFAIDNIDASLNPKLCQELMRNLIRLSRNNGKQVILTTHNPAILDGMNLDEDDQRLFIISRGRRGETRVRCYKKPATEEKFPARMSELFLRGALGGLPKGF